MKHSLIPSIVVASLMVAVPAKAQIQNVGVEFWSDQNQIILTCDIAQNECLENTESINTYNYLDSGGLSFVNFYLMGLIDKAEQEQGNLIMVIDDTWEYLVQDGVDCRVNYCDQSDNPWL